MNPSIEKAIADSLLQNLGAPLPAVLPATTDGMRPDGEQMVVVSVADLAHEVEDLYTATVGLFVDTPRLEVFTAGLHGALCSRVEGQFQLRPEQAYPAFEAWQVVLAQKLAVAGWFHCGHFIDDSKAASGEQHWIHIITLRMGLRRIEPTA